MRNKTITIDPEQSDAEGLCASICPTRIFSHEEKMVPTVSNEEE